MDTNFNYQLEVHTNLRGDSVICTVGSVLHMPHSSNGTNQGIQIPLYQLNQGRKLHKKRVML